MYPDRPNFRSAKFGDAWWFTKQGAEQAVCEFYGLSFIAMLQAVLFASLSPGYQSFDGTQTTRPRIDGTWGPQTHRALWAHLKKLGAPQVALNAVESDARAGRIGPEALRAAIWALFYQPRATDIVVGTTRTTRLDPPYLMQLPLSEVTLASGAIPPAYLERPQIPETGLNALYLPLCTPRSERDTMTAPPEPTPGLHAPPASIGGTDTTVPGGGSGNGGQGGAGGAGGAGGSGIDRSGETVTIPTFPPPQKQVPWATYALVGAIAVTGIYLLTRDGSA